MAKKKAPALRSVQWFGRQDIYGFIYRSWVKNRGVPHDQFDGRPVIGICNTYSELDAVQQPLPHDRRARQGGRAGKRRLSARSSR
jgi:dihydroxyacid dehydratase/phosphogluconate dehydratase